MAYIFADTAQSIHDTLKLCNFIILDIAAENRIFSFITLCRKIILFFKLNCHQADMLQIVLCTLVSQSHAPR